MLITLVINSLLNGTNPVAADEIPYNVDSMYVGSVHDETDFQKLYTNFTGSGKASDKCDLSTVSCKATEPKDGANGYLWIKNADVSDKNLSKLLDNNKISFKKGEEIVAPFSGTMITKASKSQQGTYMEFESDSKVYKITITNMGRWWCCRGRKPSVSEKPGKKFTHTSEHEGHDTVSFKANELLGYATSKTEVKFLKQENGVYTEIDPTDFY